MEKYGLGKGNDCGDKLVEFYTIHNRKHNEYMLKSSPKKKVYMENTRRCQIDFITVKNRFNN